MKYEEVLLFFCTQRGYIMKDVSMDQQLVLVKFGQWTSVFFLFSFFALHPHCIYSSMCDSSCVHMSPDCLLSPCCCIYRVPYLRCKMIIMMNRDGLGLCVNSWFCLFVLSPLRWWEMNLFSVFEAVLLLYSHHDRLPLSFWVGFFFFFNHLSISGANVLPTGP